MPNGKTGVSMSGTIEYTRLKKKKESRELKRKKEMARREVAKRESLPKNFNLCWKCAYYYQNACTFDGSNNPTKTECHNFFSKGKQPKKRNYGKRKF